MAGTVVPNLRSLLSTSRASGVRVVYLRFGAASDDYADAVPASRWALRGAGARDGAWECEVIEPLRPEPGDVVLLKTGTGGFTSSDLDTHLRNMGIGHVLYTGVLTSGCVLATATAGFDLGYYGYLIGNATATFSERLQHNTEELLASYFAEIVDTDDIMTRLAGAPTPEPASH